MSYSLITGCWLLSSALADDTADLRAIVEGLFIYHAKKDLDSFMALWSEESPEYASRKQTMQQLFAVNDFSFANLYISPVKVESDNASLRVSADSTTTNVQSKQTGKQGLVATSDW